MKQINSTFYPVQMNLDVDPARLKNVEGKFLKNTRFKLSGNTNISTGGVDGMITPVQSNEIFYNIELPAGKNICIGSYEFLELNELYWFVWNSEGKHTIWVIDGLTETANKVFQGECLNFSLNQENAIPENRVHVKVQYSEDNGVQVVREKYLFITNYDSDVFQINVIASIATNGYSTPYFAPVYPYHSCCDLIALAPVAPNYMPEWTFVDRDNTDEEKQKQNKLFNRSIQLAYQLIYIDGRQSSVSPYSKPIIVGGTSCSELNPDTLPRCVDVQMWVGNALVDKINIYYRECTECVSGDCSTNWVLYDTIQKNKCETENWWERQGNWVDYNYNQTNNQITYRFCADKECTPVDQNIFLNIENLVPFKSSSLFPVGDRIGLANNLRGSNNLSCDQAESFTVNVTEQGSSGEGSCDVQRRKITMYVVIMNDSVYNNSGGNEVQFLFGNLDGGAAKAIDGRFYWGGFGYRKHPITGQYKVCIDGKTNNDTWKSYQQYVPEKINDLEGGLVGYLAGTNYVAVSKQVKINYGNCQESEMGIIYRKLADMYKNLTGSFDDIVKEMANREYIIAQKFEFNDIPAGKYVFRLGNHRIGLSANYQSFSTYVDQEYNVACKFKDSIPNPATYKEYEAWVDVCASDYNSMDEGKALRMIDTTYPAFDVSAENKFYYNLITEAYLYEDDNFSVPMEKQHLDIELAYFKNRVTGSTILIDDNPALSELIENKSRITDHNGFTFYRQNFWRRKRIFLQVASIIPFTLLYTEPTLARFKFDYVDGCAISQTPEFTVGSTSVSPPVNDMANPGLRGLKGTVQKSADTLNECNRITLTGTIVDSNGSPIAGANVGFTEGQFIRTDGFGKFNVVVHQEWTPGGTPNGRTGYFIISSASSSCAVSCTDGCTSCCVDTYQEFDFGSLCYSGEPPCTTLTIDVGEILMSKINFPDKGLKGRYGFGVVGWDCYGRIVTGAVNNIGYVDTSNCWDKHPIISWNHSGVALPHEVKYISFFRTQNLNGTIIQWIADKFILVDENGNETSNRGQAAAVAIDMTSLLEYNRKNNLNTLVSYSFTKGDIVKILDDCDNPLIYNITGDTFGASYTGDTGSELSITNADGTTTVKTNVSLRNGGRIIIPYDARIDSLLSKCSVKIEILRPYECTTRFEPYCEVSQMIPVKNGLPIVNNGTITTFDTYKIYRNIPKKIDCDNNPSDMPFFSNNITDFWGKGCSDCGRSFTVNPYAEKRWNENEIAISKSWVNNGKYNGLSTFWTEDVKNFKNQNWGGIVAVLAQRNILLAICEYDYFTVGFSQNFLKVMADGSVQASASDSFAEPTQKVGMNYGCSFENVSTIVYFNGIAYWYDIKNSAFIQCDFQNAKDISVNQCKGYLVDKSSFIQNYNDSIGSNLNIYEVSAGICPMRKEVHLTFRYRNDVESGSDNYVNQNRNTDTLSNETIVFIQDDDAVMLQNFRSYTPEFYGKLRVSNSGIQFVSFKNGVPYRHNGKSTSFNTFYGVKSKSVIEFSANTIDGKIKIFESISEEIQPFPLMVDRIITNEKNSFSYIPYAYFKNKENIWYSEILRDMSSFYDPNKKQVSMLISGKRVFGKYALIRMIPTGDNENQYFQLNKVLVLFSGSELSMKPDMENSQ